MTFPFLLIIYSASCQHTDRPDFSNLAQVVSAITAGELYQHVSILAADSMQGRETGKPGQKKAAAYIRDEFRKFGLMPVTIDGRQTYEQQFTIPNSRKSIITLTIQGKLYDQPEDFLHTGKFVSDVSDTIGVDFTGYGNPGDYKRNVPAPVQGVMFLGDINNYAEEDRIETAFAKGYAYVFIVMTGASPSGYQELFDYLKENPEKLQSQSPVGGKRKQGHVFLIEPDLASRIAGSPIEQLQRVAEKSLKRPGWSSWRIDRTSLVINAQHQDSVIRTENILGYIRGSKTPEECIVISAHYDHVGVRDGKIYNGADDNASGTAALLELAESFSIAARKGFSPARSILFTAFTGEEKGLLGSRYYTDHPVFPLQATVTDLNIDMIGRSDTVHRQDSAYVYLIGSDKLSDELHELSEKNNRQYTHLSLDYTYNRAEDPNRFYYRSDQYSFAKHNIPVIFYFTGVHEDYHQPSDTYDKLRYENMVNISRLIFYTVWDIANRQERLRLKSDTGN